MGDIERVQRIASPVAADPAKVHKADEARDERQPKHRQEEDVIELTGEIAEDAPAPEVPQARFQVETEESHLDIAV